MAGPSFLTISHFPCWIHLKIPWFKRFKAHICMFSLFSTSYWWNSHPMPPASRPRPLSSSHISSRWLWRCCCCCSHVRPSWGFSGDSRMAARCKLLKIEKKTMDPPKWMGLWDAGDLDLVCFAGSHILRNGKGKVQVAHWIQEDNFPVQR